jgi:hypothetical protein
MTFWPGQENATPQAKYGSRSRKARKIMSLQDGWFLPRSAGT